MVLMKIIKKQLNGLLNLIKIMSRKINVRSPFYLFIDDSGLTDSSTTSTTTTTNGGTTTTTTTTQSQQYTEFYISAGRNSLSDFCNTGSSVQNIVSVPGLNKTYSNSLNSYVYTINNGNATIFNGSNKWFLVNNSPMNFAGSGSFNYWEITPQGQIVSSGTYTSCTGNNNGAGNEY